MTELDPDARSLVDLARDGADPTDADRRRVLRGLAAALTTTVALSATAGSAAAAAGGTGAAAAGAATGGSIVAWLGAGVLAGLTASTAVVVLTREGPRPATTEVRPAATVVASPAPRVEAAPSPRVEGLVEPERKVVAPSASPRAPSSASSDLGAETALLRTAQSALGRGDARAALAALDAHEAQFPSGALTEERLGARVFALCGMGRRAEAARAARALLDRAPASPLRARVLDSCIREP